MEEQKVIRCVDCKRVLGEPREDYQYMRIGENVNLWNDARISCKCGRVFRWRAKVPDEAQSEANFKVEKKIRNSLGRAGKSEIQKYQEYEINSENN